VIKSKITEEEQEALNDLLTSEGFKVLVKSILPVYLEGQQQRVLTVNLPDNNSSRLITLELAKLQGAQGLVNFIKALKASN
jgi:hypothetical protein